MQTHPTGASQVDQLPRPQIDPGAGNFTYWADAGPRALWQWQCPKTSDPKPEPVARRIIYGTVSQTNTMVSFF